MEKKYGLDEVIQFAVISGDVGLRKPDETIYELAMEQANACANQCLFIDDRESNLIPAKKLGMHILHMNR